MMKMNDLKTLKKNNMIDNDSEKDSLQIENIPNISSKSKNSDKHIKTNARIEIDASGEYEQIQQNERNDYNNNEIQYMIIADEKHNYKQAENSDKSKKVNY
jgi:Tfp pilus assembly pilus retraction ATPase PilT